MEQEMPTTPDTVASVLGITKGQRTTLDIIDEIVKGLPVKTLYRISNFVAPGDANFKFQIVSKATLARRKKQPGARLTSDESDRLARLAKVWTFAKEVWGDEENARAFLFRPHALLTDRRPIDVILGTDLGARLVEEILGRLQYGSAV
jgi:putative toxin-antitoxin system antitoxin component (TIGR02293 family)